MFIKSLSIHCMFFFTLSNSWMKTNVKNLSSLRNNVKNQKQFFMKQENIQSKSNDKKHNEYTSSFSKIPEQKYIPKSENQKLYVQYLNDPNTDIVLGVGPAGSGKTMFACYTAIQELLKGNIQKIIMTRPLISVDKEDIGFLPGSLENKMDPWTRPIFDIFSESFNKREINMMIKNGIIEISPLAYMRGRTFKNAFIIADEMQNSSPNQMLMMTTRIGEKTKMVITGDTKQSDLQEENGLLDFMNKIKKYNMITNHTENIIKLVELNSDDIERSPIVKKVLQMYESEKPKIIKKRQISYEFMNNEDPYIL